MTIDISTNIFYYVFTIYYKIYYRWSLASMLRNYYFSDIKNNNLNVYVIDQTINFGHPEFSHIITKQKWGLSIGNGEHATQVASVIVGNTIGVIRDPNIHVYNYAACGPKNCKESDIFKGLVRVIQHLKESGKRAVINMSFNRPCNGACTQFDAYFKEIISIGGIVINSGGNCGRDACKFAPSKSSYVITVGAYDYALTRVSDSNYGDCVDTWAPGKEIYSANWKGYGFNSGTSMATPAIAGLIGAMILMDDSIGFQDIKQFFQCVSGACDYVEEIADTKSKYKYAFMYDCNKIASLFYKLYNANSIESKPQESLSLKVFIPLQYIIICCIVLISLCILMISIKYASKSKIHDAPLIQKMT